MQDWNIVVSVPEHGFKQAREFLSEFGLVRRTEFFNVLAMHVDDVNSFPAVLQQRIPETPGAKDFLGRVMPVTHTFGFQSPEEFDAKAQEAVAGWMESLAGKSFHVRMHRRGFKGRLSSQQQERVLDELLIKALEGCGMPGRITFENPDAIIAVETIGQRAGLSLWTREDMQRYPFLKLD